MCIIYIYVYVIYLMYLCIMICVYNLFVHNHIYIYIRIVYTQSIYCIIIVYIYYTHMPPSGDNRGSGFLAGGSFCKIVLGIYLGLGDLGVFFQVNIC